MNKITLLIFLLLSTFCNAQSDAIKNTISTFFEGLQSSDTIIVNSVIHKDLIMQTIYLNNEGKSNLKTASKSQFLKDIATKKKEDVWFEKLLSYTIQVDENLATVWTPYKFYFNQKFSHCGVNSFQLFFNDEYWKIISIIDTRRKDNCIEVN
jgi:hypothetical protein